MRVVSVLAGLLLASPAVAQQTYSPPFTASVVGSNVPGLQSVPFFMWAGGAFNPNPTLRIDRDVESGAGAAGNTYKALWVLGATWYTSPGYEWTITGEQHNRTRASTGAQNVAVNGTIWRDPTDDGSPTGPSWALNGNCVDTTNEQPPTNGCIGAEIDVGGAIGPDPNRQRVGIHVAGGGQPGSHVGYGVMVSPTPGTTIDRAFSTANVGGQFGIGLDLAGGSFSSAAILMGQGQWFGIDGDADGHFSRFFGFNPADQTLTYMTAGGPMLRFSDDGAARVGRLIQTIPHVPASVSAPCETGEQAYDASFFYVCISPSRWRRAALSDF